MVASPPTSRARQTGVSNGGVSRTGLVFPFLSFLGLSRFFRDFPICSGMVRGFSRFVPFLFLGHIKSTYEEQSRNGPRHNPDLSRKKWETPGYGNPRFSFSQLRPPWSLRFCDAIFVPLSTYRYLWRFLGIFPRKTRCFRDPAVVFCYRCIFCHHHSELI